MRNETSFAKRPDVQWDPPKNTDFSIKWGKKTGDVELTSMKTYGQNPASRKSTQVHLKENLATLKKLTRMQILSFITQLEEKNLIECPMKGCRCIFMSVPEIADHFDSCVGAKGNVNLKMCKYCPHGTLSSKTLFNHIAVSHPYASDVMIKNCLTYDNSVNEEIKTKFFSSENFQQTIKNHWRIYLESKGYIMCLVPYCHYVTSSISKMVAHFSECGPDLWGKLTFPCKKCAGRTFSKEERDDHVDRCHTSDITYNTCNGKIKEFWELTMREFQISKCVSEKCKFIAHNITTLEKHYRYCRNPSEENYEVCTLCGCWLDNTYDLWRHETQFHVLGKSNKIRKLMSMNVNNIHEYLFTKKPSTACSDNTQSAPEESTERYMKDVVLKKTTFLGELAKTIESESKNIPYIDARVTVENQFSWHTKAPDVKIAGEVVNRRLPSYSVKTIMAESIEDGARLLKLTESVASIACNLPKKYIPPRPLDFVLDHPDALSKLRKKFVSVLPAPPKKKISEVSVPKGKVQYKKCTNLSVEKKRKPVNGSRSHNERQMPPAKKSKCVGPVSLTHPGLRRLLPVKPDDFGKVAEKEVCQSKPSVTESRARSVKKRSNKLASDAVILESVDDGITPDKVILGNNGSGRYLLAGQSVLNHILSKHSADSNPVAKDLKAHLADDPRLASLLLQSGGKSQIPKSFKIIRLVPGSKPGAAKPVMQYQLPSETPQSNSSVVIKNYSSLALSKSSPVDLVNGVRYSNENGKMSSSIPFELPILPPIKSIIFGESSPISDYPNGISSPRPSEDPSKPNKTLRTYGKNGCSTRNSLFVENAMRNDVDESVLSGLFTDMDIDKRECIDDPLHVEKREMIEVKTEPIEDWEDFENDDSCVMFHESYDIFDVEGNGGGALSTAFDSSIPFEVFCESSEAVSSGLYNDRCPWELAKMRRPLRRTIPESSPYISKEVIGSSVCNSQSSAMLSIKAEDSLNGSHHECSLEVSNSGENKGELKELLVNLTNGNGSNFVNEPMIYSVDKLIYDNLPQLSDMRTNGKKSEVVASKQGSMLAGEGRTCRASSCGSKMSIVDNHMDEFLDLVNYLTNYNSYNFPNSPVVYAVDEIIHDSPLKLSASEKNGKESVKGHCRKSSVIREQGCSRAAPSTEVDSSSESRVKPDMKSEELPPVKKKRKRNSSALPKSVDSEESAVVSSSDGINTPNEGSLLEDNSLTEASTVKNEDGVREEPESSVSASPGVSSVAPRAKRTARKSARLLESIQEPVAPVILKKKRPSKKVLNIHAVHEIAPGVIVPLPDDVSDEKEEKRATKKKGRPRKRKSLPVMNGVNVPRSSFTVQPPTESFLYIQGDDDLESDTLVPADRRIMFNTKLVDPLKMVECAICGESMTAAVYKNEHIVRHNHLCWLKGEEPMDLDDEKGVERFLYRIYMRKRVPFVCEVCGAAKKSALGFVTHRKFCGKSVRERKELMVTCSVCSRLLLPSSLHSHMVKTHPVISSVPEEPPLQGRLAASKCLDVLAATAKDIKDDQVFIDDSEELKAVEQHSWVRQAYSFCKRRVHREQKNLMMESASPDDLNYHCIIGECTFSDNNINNVIEHYRACDVEPLDTKCKECNFMTNVETRMINHVRMIHFDKAKDYSSNEFKNEGVDVSDVSGAFIPYIKSGELGCRSMLYLQPALYWTHDLRAEHFSSEPLFTDWGGPDNLAAKAFDEFPSHLCLRNDSIRFKGSDDTPEWSVLKKFTSENLDDDVHILYTGGIVRTFDWFPSPATQYLAVGIASVDSESISACPVHSGPGHFQIWSAGSVGNFSEPYDADLRFCVAVCHDFGEIWDLECCPSGGLTEKRLGLVAIGTSSGFVPVYSISIPQSSSEERAIKPDPVVVLKLGTKESFQVSKISWSKTKPHRFIAAGFTNGLVAVWDLTTTSTLLKSGNTLLPFKSFYPHLAIITALSFSPVNEYYIATGCAEKCSKFWNLHDTTAHHGEFGRGLVTDVAWVPHWMAALTSLDDNYTTGTTTVTLNPIRNFIYQTQPAVTQADSTATSISVNNWLNTFVCGYDSGQIVLSIERKYIQHQNDDRRKVFNCLLSPRLHDFDPNSPAMVSCKSYSSTSARYGLILNHNFQMNFQMKIKGNPCTDLACFPLTPVNKICWNPNPNSFLTLATGLHSGFIIISRVKLPTMETRLIKSILESYNPKVS